MTSRNDRDRRCASLYDPAHALFLAERAVRRWATYCGELADLTKEGSVEPRLWIGSIESLWSGLVGDYGDYLRRLRGEDAKACAEPTHAPTSPFRFLEISEGKKVQELAFEVPSGLFESVAATTIALSIDGMWRNGDRVLRSGTHMRFTPAEVRSAARASKLRFYDLPESLRAGMTLVGTVVFSILLAAWPLFA